MVQTIGRSSQRGGALLVSLVVVSIVAGLAAAAFTLGFSQNLEINTMISQTRALYMAESGVSDSMMSVGVALQAGGTVPASLGTPGAPVPLRGGGYDCDIADNGNATYTITSTGRVGATRRTIEAVAAPVGGDIFEYAVFAGNSSGSVGYDVTFGGNAAQADQINGNVFSGGGVNVSGAASVSGGIDAAGVIVGAMGATGVDRPLPNILAMDYANHNDFDVASLFSTATWSANALGGSAWQLPESSPAHIFRKNPSDRASEVGSTTKDDYFLEDPYETIGGFIDPNGDNGALISLSGTGGKPGPSGTNKVYYIDGNLWVHNSNLMSMQLANPDAAGAKVTFVVKGNIYFGDNVYIDDAAKSAVAFIAIKDDSEPSSGNIYLGDPTFGTLDYLESYLYAENDFYDNNLDASGSLEIELHGIMSAGNHVDINRDYVHPDGSISHSRLFVDFDDRISTGAITLPGLPTSDTGVAGMKLLSWREVPR